MRTLGLIVLMAVAVFGTSCSSDCVSPTDCALGSQCCRGVCVSALAICVECDADTDCSAEQICDQNVCIAKPVPRRDGGPIPNRAPMAVILGGGRVNVNEVARLDASNSTDPDGDALTYAWRIVSAPATSTAALTATDLEVVNLRPTLLGVYSIELVVFDGELSSDPATVMLNATEFNNAPVADAGPDEVVALTSSVTLDGSGSMDLDGDPLTYQWRIANAPASSTAVIVAPTSSITWFQPDIDGIFDFELVVDDGLDSSAPSTKTVSVSFVNPGIATFDPNEAYIVGRVIPMDPDSGVIADIRTPSSLSAGFPTARQQIRAEINPVTGELLYLVNTENLVRSWRPEPLTRGPDRKWILPTDPVGNDVTIPHPPGCTQVLNFWIVPDTGEVYFRCLDLGNVTVTGALAPSCRGLGTGAIAFGYRGSILCGPGNAYIDPMGQGVTHPELMGANRGVSYWRAMPDGGFLVILRTTITDPRPFTRYRIWGDGSLTNEGTYPESMFDAAPLPNSYSGALMQDGTFFRAMLPTLSQNVFILRYPANFQPPLIAYDETQHSLIWDTSSLVTGP